jgi:S1-C subfamily serine protease
VDPNDEIRDARSGHDEEAATPAAPAAPTAVPWWSRTDEPAAPGGQLLPEPPIPGQPQPFQPQPFQPLSDTAAFAAPAASAYAAPAPDVYGAPAPDVIEGSGRDTAKRRPGLRQAAALTVAAVVISAAASGTVVHLVDDHSGNSGSATAATTTAAGSATSGTTTQTSSGSTLPPAAQVASDVKTALAKIEPSVVLINDTITSTASGRGGGGGGGFGGFGGFQESGAGTGIIITATGEVVTNAHVVNGATDIKVTLPGSTATHTATIVGINASEDLAVIQIAGVSGLTPATFANSDTAAVGDNVLAVGNALGYGGAPTVTEGILSAKGRSLTGSSDNLSNLLQTDAAINPGNSGGPLVDSTGNVIGINVAVASGSATEPAQNIGFAIASNTVVSALPALKAGANVGTQSQGATQSGTFLGVSVTDATPSGALVEAVQAGSPADTAGIQAGDIITAINGKTIADGTALQQAIRSSTAGTAVTVTLDRNGATTTVHATLGTTQVSS